MRVRALDANGDMTFGKGSQNFYVNTPAAVAQKIQTRLGLFTGEWFLDLTDGTPWYQDVLGAGTENTYDLVIRERILDTDGVLEIVSYSSSVNHDTRKLTVTCVVNTIYGVTDTLTTEIPI